MDITDATLEKLGVTETSNLNCLFDADLSMLAHLVEQAQEHGVYDELHPVQVFLYIQSFLGHRVMCLTVWENSDVAIASGPILFSELVNKDLRGFEQARDVLNRIRTKITELQEAFKKHYAPVEQG